MKKVSIKPLFESAINEAPVTNSPQAFFESAHIEVDNMRKENQKKFRMLGAKIGQTAASIAESRPDNAGPDLSRQYDADFLEMNCLHFVAAESEANKTAFKEGFDESMKTHRDHPPFDEDKTR